jgi:hypothetical protein
VYIYIFKTSENKIQLWPFHLNVAARLPPKFIIEENTLKHCRFLDFNDLSFFPAKLEVKKAIEIPMRTLIPDLA